MKNPLTNRSGLIKNMLTFLLVTALIAIPETSGAQSKVFNKAASQVRPVKVQKVAKDFPSGKAASSAKAVKRTSSVSSSGQITSSTNRNINNGTQSSFSRPQAMKTKDRPAKQFNRKADPLQPAGKGSTGRVIAKNSRERTAMKEIKTDPKKGEIIKRMPPLSDTRWEGWRKMRYNREFKNQKSVEIHYNALFNKQKQMVAVDDFKFMDVRKMPKTTTSTTKPLKKN